MFEMLLVNLAILKGTTLYMLFSVCTHTSTLSNTPNKSSGKTGGLADEMLSQQDYINFFLRDFIVNLSDSHFEKNGPIARLKSYD